MAQEPVAVINGSVALVEATLSLAVGFHVAGLNMDAKEVALVMAVVVAAGNLVKTLWARGHVTPVSDPRNNQGQRLVAEPAFVNPAMTAGYNPQIGPSSLQDSNRGSR